MKDIFVIILIGAIILSMVYLFNSKMNKDKKNLKNKSLKTNCEKDDPKKEKYVSLIDALQCDYRLGVPNGTYIPVPVDEQPINALPFNPGLKPCEFTLV